MAGGGVESGAPGKRAHLYEHRFTNYFAFTCIVGALGGSLFGYDLGVSGLSFSVSLHVSVITFTCSALPNYLIFSFYFFHRFSLLDSSRLFVALKKIYNKNLIT